MSETHTADDYTAAIVKAVQAHDVEAVPHLLTLMAVCFPHEAQDVLDMIRLGLRLRGDAEARS